VGIARRRPTIDFAKTVWVQADIERDELEPHLAGADAVVHLAWKIQPSRDLDALRGTNVLGSGRVFEAVAKAGVRNLVYASSVGVYSPGPKNRFVDESWPRDGIPTSFYSRHKAEVERILDRFEQEAPAVRVVRLRPALIFKRDAGEGIRRLFFGPFLPSALVRPRLLPLVPDLPRLRFQAVDSFDVANAYRLALLSDVRGAFNLAADPVLDGPMLARLLDARRVRMSARLLRGVVGLSWRLRLQPTPAGWIDLALGVPLLDVTRARTELRWTPTRTAADAFLQLVQGIRERRGIATPPLSRKSSGQARTGEFATGVGQHEPPDGSS